MNRSIFAGICAVFSSFAMPALAMDLCLGQV